MFFSGTILLTLSWIAGLPMLWKGQPKLALWSSGLCMLLGAATAAATMLGPRNSDLLYGSLHRGDGFGLIGLIVLGAGTGAVALVVLILTAMAAAARKAMLKKEASA